MVKVELRFVHRTINRHGRAYYTFRKKGVPRTRLPGVPGHPAFMKVYGECLEAAESIKGPNQTTVMPGSMTALVRAFYNSKQFLSLAESTQRTYRRTLDGFCDEHGANAVNRLHARHIEDILAKKVKTPAAANQLRKRLKQVLQFGLKKQWIKTNPAEHVDRIAYHQKPHHTWEEEEAEQFVKHHPLGTMAYLAFAIMANTGLRKSDAVRLGRAHIVGNKIVFRTQQKTRAPVIIPISQQLAEALNGAEDRMIFLVNGQGRPFTANGFGNWMRERCDEAGLPQCSSHGLRSLIGKRLAEAGCNENTISSILGHKNNQQAALYTRAANREKLAQEGIRAINLKNGAKT